MKRSFYHYMLTLRGSKIHQAESQLAYEMAQDIQFPKQADTYHEVSNYLELSTDYLENLTLFDHCWDMYLEHNQL
ncbi:YozE family protein [Vagococcus salmoninarum]|uniref:YozE family protein n=1 Tax=Vagococcus salmoninarum TaxID=2739 RepID=UPI003F952C55